MSDTNSSGKQTGPESFLEQPKDKTLLGQFSQRNDHTEGQRRRWEATESKRMLPNFDWKEEVNMSLQQI